MRVLIHAPNWLGDMVMALPAIASIRRHFPSDTLAVAAPASLAPLFSAVPGVDLVVPLEGAEAGGKSRRWVWRAQARVIVSGRFDVVILLPNSFHAAWVAKRAGVPERWGYRADLRGWLLTKAIPRKRRRSGEVLHQEEYYQDLVRALGIDPVPVRASYHGEPAGSGSRDGVPGTTWLWPGRGHHRDRAGRRVRSREALAIRSVR